VEFAMRASEADGYALHALDMAYGNLVLRYRGGIAALHPTQLSLTRGPVCHEGITYSSYPLLVDEAACGLLTFIFCADGVCKEKLVILDRLSPVIEAVFRLPHLTTRLVSKINSLELELTHLKINERTFGLLANGVPTDNTVETVVRHVENVLRRRPAVMLLERLLYDLEDRLAEKKLVVKAKHLLQCRDRISEEEAYLRLIHRSRASRKRLREVAGELIASIRNSSTTPRRAVNIAQCDGSRNVD